MPIHLVIGATGTVGREVTRAALSTGIHVRVGLRSTTKGMRFKHMGADVVKFDFTDEASMRSAFKGVFCAFLMVPFGKEQDTQVAAAVKMAAAQNVGHIVLMTSLRSSTNKSALFEMHARMEQSVIACGIPYTIIRPTFFMQNFVTAHGDSIRHAHKFHGASGDGKVTYIDCRDIGDCVGKIMKDLGSYAGRTLKLTGCDPVTSADIAVLLTNAIGTPIEYQNNTEEQERALLKQFELPEFTIQAILDLEACKRNGECSEASGDTASILGHAPRSFGDFVSDFAHMWRNSPQQPDELSQLKDELARLQRQRVEVVLAELEEQVQDLKDERREIFSESYRPSDKAGYNVSLLGCGPVAQVLGTRLAEVGYDIRFGARDLASNSAYQMEKLFPPGYVLPLKKACAHADIIFLVMKGLTTEKEWKEFADSLEGAADGKIVIDATNCITFGRTGCTQVFRTVSGAEIIQALLPKAHVVKGFNTFNWAPRFYSYIDYSQVTLPYCGNHSASKSAVHRLITDIGMEPLDVGPLRIALNLESWAELWINMCFVTNKKLYGDGQTFTFKLIHGTGHRIKPAPPTPAPAPVAAAPAAAATPAATPAAAAPAGTPAAAAAAPAAAPAAEGAANSNNAPVLGRERTVSRRPQATPGWFMKMGRMVGFSAQQRRYLVLKGNQILYFKTFDGARPSDQKGAIKLTRDTTIEQKGTRIYIHTPDRTWDITAATQKVADEWTNALQAVVKTV